MYWTLEFLTQLTVKAGKKNQKGQHGGAFSYEYLGLYDPWGKEVERIDISEQRKKLSRGKTRSNSERPALSKLYEAKAIAGLLNSVCKKLNLELVTVEVLPWQYRNMFFYKRLFFLKEK